MTKKPSKSAVKVNAEPPAKLPVGMRLVRTLEGTHLILLLSVYRIEPNDSVAHEFREPLMARS